MASILIVYNAEDCEKWASYIKTLISKSDIRVGLCDLNTSMITFTMDTLVVPLVSPSMLVPEMEQGIEYLRGHPNIVLLDCFLNDDEKEEFSVKFPFLQSTKMLAMTVVKSENYDLVSELVEMAETLEKQLKARSGKIKKQCSKFILVPNTIYQQPLVVYLNFERELPGAVTVTLGKSCVNRTKTEKYNPYSVMFTAENLCDGHNEVAVFVEGIKVGVRDLDLRPPELTAYECPSYLCQVLGVGSHDTRALDKALVDIFRKSAPSDKSHINLLGENPKRSGEGSDSHSAAEVPTLLHFAAKNGLIDLCADLLNLPGSADVCRITNCRGKNICDLAMESGFQDVANYTKLFVETEAMVVACNTFYKSMKGCQKDGANQADETQKQTERLDPLLESGIYSVPLDTSGVYSVPLDTSGVYTAPLGTAENFYLLRRPFLEEPEKPVVEDQRESKIDDRPPEPPPKSHLLPKRNTRNAGVFESEPRSGSRAMDELIDINKQAMEGHFTLKEAEMLFESWKKRNTLPSASIRQKQENLQQLKNKYGKLIRQSSTEEKSVINGLLDRLMRKSKKKNINIDITKPVITQGPPDSAALGRWSNISSSSSGSNDSRASQFSTASVDSSLGASVAGSDNEDTMKSSKKEQFLKSISSIEGLDLPPPIPPRNPNIPPLPSRKY
ncbi:phosphoinositide 3-kinase adapter protein 1-like isoform X2 [Argopecten irradians]|uniref:phosphoinositide 3-kinase adapter protein 1-like isoform X2 n=1 Tax=Argopecten irradians TaxID=31199 RepID=UPI00371F209D